MGGAIVIFLELNSILKFQMKSFNLTVHNTSVNFHGAYHYHSNHASQKENRFYNRETIRALNTEIHQMIFYTLLCNSDN